MLLQLVLSPPARGVLASCHSSPYIIFCNWRDWISRKVLDTLRYATLRYATVLKTKRSVSYFDSVGDISLFADRVIAVRDKVPWRRYTSRLHLIAQTQRHRCMWSWLRDAGL